MRSMRRPLAPGHWPEGGVAPGGGAWAAQDSLKSGVNVKALRIERR